MFIPIRIARIFYAIALIAWGIQDFLLGDFIGGRAPAWPVGLPGQIPFAYASGIILIVAGIAVMINKKAKLAAVVAGMMILLWSGLRNIYAWIITLDYGDIANLSNTEFHPINALTMGFGALLVAATFDAVTLPGSAKSRANPKSAIFNIETATCSYCSHLS